MPYRFRVVDIIVNWLMLLAHYTTLLFYCKTTWCPKNVPLFWLLCLCCTVQNALYMSVSLLSLSVFC